MPAMTGSAVTATAPTRIDLAGGTLDIWPLSMLVPGALTLNVAIDLAARVTVRPRRDGKVRIVSRDRRRQVTRRAPLALDDVRGPLALLQRLVAAFEPRGGLDLISEASAPAGAGLGGSSALGIAAAAALARFTGQRLGSARMLQRVMNLEAIELNVPTGSQDYLAALHGGLGAYHHGPDGIRHERVQPPAGFAERVVLAYTGQPRDSGFSNWEMFRRFVDGERVTVERMRAIARIAAELLDALRAGDLDACGKLIGEEGRLRYRLAPSVSTPLLRAAGAAARRAGALGVKVCGAGGGGCMVAIAAAGRGGAVARAISASGARVLDVGIAARGVRVRTAARSR